MLLFLPIGALLALSHPSLAQVTVKMEVSKRQFVANEPVTARVTLTNRAGRELYLHATPRGPWLDFVVAKTSGVQLSPRRGKAQLKAVKIPAGRTMTQDFPLSSWFDLTQIGNYIVYAIVRMPEDAMQGFQSNRAPFSVTTARRIYTQRVGTKGGKSIREFRLMSFAGADRSALYCEVENIDTRRVIKTFPLDKYVPYMKPQATVDGKSFLHVLYQAKAQKYTHAKINPDGKIVSRKHYSRGATGLPRLEGFSDGKVIVAGGVSYQEQAKKRKQSGQTVRKATDRPALLYRK